MIFNSYLFLGIFLPAVLLVFYMPGLRRWRTATMLAASLVFYGVSGLEHLGVLILDIVWVFALTRLPGYQRQPLLLAAAIALPVVLLLYYKYLGFLLADVLMLDIAPSDPDGTFNLFENVVLPAGISFFTFQVASYAIDRYRATVAPAPNLTTFALYISFFPQLVAGPIVRFAEVRDRLIALADFRPEVSAIATAIAYIVLGMAVKVLIADTLGGLIAPMVETPGAGTALLAVYVIFAYSFQIYFDFFGYSMIAIGLARLIGIELPINFDRPYQALNPREFWRRWHITLSFWIRDYLYLPLGGNRAYMRNILFIFLIAGLWHGAGWSFVAWGLFHGLLVVGYHLVRQVWGRMPQLLQTAVNFTLVSAAWLLFLYDFTNLGAFLDSLSGQGSGMLANPDVNMWVALGVAAAVCFGVDLNRLAARTDWSAYARSAYTVMLASLTVGTILFIDRSDTFIYFRF